jgi:hypothetical protein
MRNRPSDFEVKPLTNCRHRFCGPDRRETVQVVLRPNHSQTVDLGFEAQPRNSCSSFPHAWCRPHTVPPDLSIAHPLSIQPVRPSPVLCTMSPTPAMILIVSRHACHTPVLTSITEASIHVLDRWRGPPSLPHLHPARSILPCHLK